MNVRARWKKNTKADKTAGSNAVGEKSRAREGDPATSGADVSRINASQLRLPLFLAIVSIIGIGDQIVKAIVVRRLYLHDSITIIPEFFSITRIHNNGIAFGLFQDRLPQAFLILTLISMLAVLYFYLTIRPRGILLTIACSMILGGALGNMIDRFRLGYVVDFINFSFWPAFNVADSAVSVGVALLMLSFFRRHEGMAEDASGTAENRAG